YFSRWSADGQGGLNSAFPGRNVINRATAGKGTYVTLQAVRSHVDIAPRVVIIQVGIADVPFFEAGKETVYPQLVEQLRSLYPQASLVLTSTIMQGGNTPDTPLEQKRSELNGLIRSLANGKQIHFVDLDPVFSDQRPTLIQNTAISPLGYERLGNA